MDDPNYDLQSLSGVTLAEEPEVSVEHDELLGAGSNFHWRIRITPPTTRRFSLSPYTRNREVIVKLTSRRMPNTIDDFQAYIQSYCPNIEGRGLRLRCSVWPTSPYSIVPVQFSDDLHFSPARANVNDAPEEEHQEQNAKYRNLINGCREYAMNCPRREVEFEIKIVFSKEGRAITGRE